MDDVSVWHVANDQAILHGDGGAWTLGNRASLLIGEQLVEEGWWHLFKSDLLSFLLSDSISSWGSFLSLSGCCSSFGGLFLGSDLLWSWFCRLNLDQLLFILSSLHGLYEKLGLSILEVEPELPVSNILVAYESSLLWKLAVLILLHFFDSKSELVFVNN